MFFTSRGSAQKKNTAGTHVIRDDVEVSSERKPHHLGPLRAVVSLLYCRCWRGTLGGVLPSEENALSLDKGIELLTMLRPVAVFFRYTTFA